MYLPQTKTSPIISAINSMVAAGVNDLTLARVRRNILELEQAGMFVEALQVKGMVAALEGDVVEADRKFSAATAASGNLPVVIFNHAIAMQNLHYYEPAIDLIRKAVEKAPGDPGILREAFDIHIAGLDADGAAIVLERLEMLMLVTDDDRERLASAEYKKSLLASYGTDWRDAVGRIALVAETVRNAGWVPRAFREAVADDGLLCLVCLEASADELCKAEHLIHSVIADLPYSPVDSAVSFGCTELTADDLRP